MISQLRPGDVLLACSDGVWHYFSPTELASVVDSLSPREATEFLIEKARSRARGGGDNLSLVIVKIEALVEEKRYRAWLPPRLEEMGASRPHPPKPLHCNGRDAGGMLSALLQPRVLQLMQSE